MQDICKFSNIILCYTELSIKADKMQRNELRCVYVTLADFIIVSGKILIQLGLNQRLNWGRFWRREFWVGKVFCGVLWGEFDASLFFRWIWCLVTCKSQHFAARLKSRTTALLQIVILLFLGCLASSVYMQTILYTWFKRILRGNFKAFLWTCFCWKVPVWSRTPKTCFTIERLWKTPSQILDPQLSPYCNIVFTYHNAFWKYEATSPVNPVRASPNPRLSSHHSTAGPLRKK